IALSATGATYNGEEQKPVVTVTFNGNALVADADYTIDWGEGAWTNAGTYTVKVTGQGNFSGEQTAEFTIGLAEVTVTAESKGKTYGDVDPVLTAKVEGMVNGESSADLITYTIVRDAGEVVGTYAITLSGASVQGNYSVSYVPGILSIAKATRNDVTVAMSGWTYGEAAASPAVSADFSAEGEPSIAYAVKKTGDYAESDWSVTRPSTAGTYVVRATVAETSNYVGGSATAEFTIAPAAIQVALSENKTYNGLAQTPTLTVKSGETSLTENVDYTVSWNRTGFVNADSYTVTVSGKNNYTGTETATYVIGLAEVTVSAESKGKTYGDVDPALTAKVEGMVNGESSADLITYTIVRDAGEVVGTYAITLSGASVQGNYSVSYVPGILSIAKATRNDVTVAMSGWTYGEAAASPAVSADFSAEGEPSIAYAVKKTGDYAESDWSVTRPSTAGTYVVRATVAETSNYVGGSATAEFTIAPAAIQVALSENKTYNGLAQTPTLTVKSGETSLTENVDYTVSWNRTGFVNADSYTVTVSGKNNYTGTETATFIIAKKSVEISVNASSKMYGENDPIFTGVVSGLISENDLGLIRYVREIIDSNVGTYMNSLNALYTENDNYEVSVIKGDFEVTKRAIVITSATDSKFYDGVEFVNHQISVTGDGYADGESLDCIVSGRITEVGRSNNTLTCTSSNTAELANYAVTMVEGTLTINPVVTFVMNGHGEAISSQNILLGEKVSVPVAPMDASYNFMGWFIDNETFVKPYDFESAVMENRTLYAKWIAKTKILVAKYGEGADDTIHVVVSVINSEAENIADIGNAFVNHVPAIAIPMKPSTLTTDYPFDTWIKSESDIDGLDVYVPVFKATPRSQQEIIVAVNGMELNVDVPVDGTPEEIITAIENALAEHDPAIIPQPTNPHRDSTYTFKDWIKNEDGKYVPEFDSSYKPDVIIQVAVNDSVINSVAIRPYDNGKDISTKIDSELNKQGVAVFVPTSTDSTEFVLDSWIQNEVTGLYEAVFVERSKTFTITYVAPSAMLSDSIMSYTYGSVTKLPKAFIPQDSGWVFRGWYTRVNGLGNRVTSITSTDYGNKKFYAFFQMSISYEAKDIRGNVEVAYDADTKKAIETALNSVIPKDFEQGGMTMTFDKWEKTVDGVYVATFKESVSIANTMTTPKFNVSLNDRNLTISDAEIGAKIMIADLKGCVVYNGVIGSSDHMIVLPTAGNYVLRVNNQTSRVVVK
ncbi:MAG: InlB B-repeat-containing protein, partial [Fibrobacter sp.]|nr:InlB B-repeat-containing protein [Fibrobacter sp.]